MSPLDKIAPYPRSEKEATAEAMQRTYAAYAQLNWRLSLDHPSATERAKATLAVVSYYALTYLLREMEERAGTKQADEVARILWEDLENPQVIGPTLHEWLVDEFGIDIEAINKVADECVKPNPEAGTQAGMGGAA